VLLIDFFTFCFHQPFNLPMELFTKSPLPDDKRTTSARKPGISYSSCQSTPFDRPNLLSRGIFDNFKTDRDSRFLQWSIWQGKKKNSANRFLFIIQIICQEEFSMRSKLQAL
jgi:hypothetical protein